MKPLKITFIIALIAVCVAIAALAVLSRMYLNPETIESSLRFEAARVLKREISFKKVTVGLFKGISLEEVTIHKSPPEREELLVCKKIDLKFSYLPLLLKKLMIRDITIEEPRLNLATAKGQLLSLTGNCRPPSGGRRRLGLLLLPRSLYLHNGTNRLLNSRSDPLMSLHGFQVAAGAISLIAPFQFSAEARLPGSSRSGLQCTGTASLPKKYLSADVSLEGFSLEHVRGLLQSADLPLQEGSAALKAAIRAEYGKPLCIDGTVELKDLSLAASPPPRVNAEIALNDAAATLVFQSEWNTLKQEFHLKDIRGRVLSSPCSGSGMIRWRGGKTIFNCSLHSEKFSLDTLFSHVEFGPKSPARGLGLSGFANVRASLTSTASGAPIPALLVTLERNQLSFPGLGSLRPELQGRFKIDPDKITILNLKAGTADLSVTLAGDLDGYRRWPPKSSLKMLSSHIDFKALFTPDEQAPAEPLGPFDFSSLRFSGPVSLGSTTFLGIRLNDVQGTYLFENNTFFIKGLSGRIDQGRFTLDGSANLGVKGLDYYTALSVESVPLKSVMVVFPGIPYRNLLKGKLAGTCALRSRGQTAAPFFKSLTGDAAVDISDATLRVTHLMPELASLVKVPALKQINFNQAHLEFMLRSGTVFVEGNLNSPELELHPSGEIRLDTSLDMDARLKISPELLGRSTYLARYLPREGDRVSLPLTIRGTLQDPRVSLSEETMQYIFKESLPRLLMDMLSEKADSDNGTMAEVIESLTGDSGSTDTEAAEEDAEEEFETDPAESELFTEEESDPADADAEEDGTAEEFIEVEE